VDFYFLGLFGGDPEPIEKERVPIEENTDELRKNTQALDQLNVDFLDLRSELINAPSRFSLPAQPGLGRVGATGAGDVGLPPADGGGFAVNITVQGNLDQSTADGLVGQISQIYNEQSRRDSNRTRLFR
jgi:hypothetical protein